jgi:DNA polymerase I-like protein with 3'-5' exonuclease and polymerase domains
MNEFILFMQTAQSLADQRHVPLEVAESWVKNHQKTYATFHQWAERHAIHAELCGWTATPWQRRIRWVQEANAKKSGESAARSGVNNVIQATGSNIGKLALYRVGKFTRQNNIKLLAMVHDEIVFEVPGVCTLDREKSKYKKGVCVEPVWIPEEKTVLLSNQIQEIMQDAEKEVFGEAMEGRCSVAIAPYGSK